MPRYLLSGLVALSLSLACGAHPLGAQERSSAYLPISHWATPYLEHLVRARVLTLDPLTRPIRRADLARALAAADTLALAGGPRAVVRRLAAELSEERTATRWSVEAEVTAHAGSDARRESSRPAGEGGFWPRGGLDFRLELPRLVAVAHPYFDNRLREDTADFTGETHRVIAGRLDEAYLSYESRYLDAFFGAMDRNWGPPDTYGLQLSPWPYSTEHLAFRLGTSRLRLEAIAAQLDDAPNNDSVALHRYLTLHRLVVQPSPRLAVSLFEGVLYGGPARTFELWYLNPLAEFVVTMFNTRTPSNVHIGADAVWLPGERWRVFGQLFSDDFQVDRREPGDQEPSAYALTLGGSWGAASGALTASALYTRVSNLNYRTPFAEEAYQVRGVGIGRDYSDYDDLQVAASLLAARFRLWTWVSLIRQGEGDFRQPYPPVSAFDDSLTFLTGVVERRLFAGVGAAMEPAAGLHLSGELGLLSRSNAGHVRGETDSVWRLRASYFYRRAAAPAPE